MAWTIAGVTGLGTLLLYLSIECYQFFDIRIDWIHHKFIAHATLSVLWAGFATAIILIGLQSRSAVLRNIGLVVFSITVLKIFGMELFNRPPFETAILNPYFLTILCPIIAMIAFAIWTVRVKPLENKHDRDFFALLGLTAIALLWGAASVECYQYFDIRTGWPHHKFLANASLTVFWTLLAVVLAVIARLANAKALRILAVVLIIVTLVKIFPVDIWNRPDYTTPLFNPFALPFALLAFAVIFVCVSLVSALSATEKETLGERQAYQFIAFGGVVFLWLVMTLECFESVRLLQGNDPEAWRAQMAMSILWSLFGGVLIFVGFVWRSAVLRWMAILLFGMTSAKVLFVDMAGVNELYRIGAFFVLAVILTLAAWAYQRFKPENQ
jgi:uncharacterized membrane protein